MSGAPELAGCWCEPRGILFPLLTQNKSRVYQERLPRGKSRRSVSCGCVLTNLSPSTEAALGTKFLRDSVEGKFRKENSELEDQRRSRNRHLTLGLLFSFSFFFHFIVILV